jgi:predicted peptidase
MLMNRKAALVLFLLGILILPFRLAAFVATDTSIINLFRKEVFITGKDTLRYRLLMPRGAAEGKKYPLVLYLHGAGERGRDNQRQLYHVPPALVDSAGRKNFPCILLVPQCPPGQRWVEVDWGLPSHVMPAEISIAEKLTMIVFDSLSKLQSVDTTRLYITGMSMGGYGTWDLISRYPKKFAAAIPLCGGGDEAQAAKLVDIPTWAFHGKMDKVVPASRSANMVSAIKAAGGKSVMLTMYDNTAHNCWDVTYTNPTVFQWMFRQRLKIQN